MALVVCNNGESIALQYLTGKIASTRELVYRLFATNTTPAETDTAGTYTEATGGGYASKTIAGTAWTVSGTGPTQIEATQQTWTFTGALTTNGTVYGYYATRATDADLILAEAFTSFTPANNGDQILLTPRITAE